MASCIWVLFSQFAGGAEITKHMSPPIPVSRLQLYGQLCYAGTGEMDQMGEVAHGCLQFF